jgi:endonuclease/exonuclease/phosphatase family metal-dependent hydrolase
LKAQLRRDDERREVCILAAESPAMNLRVITYNIHRAIGVDRRFRPERIIELLRTHDPDVALLQEVDDGVPRSRELDLAKEIARDLGYPYYAVGHNVSLRKGKYGNATLSRLPIVRERNIDLTIDNKKRRGCQHTTLETTARGGPSGRLEVFNLHLGLSMRERQQQVGRLVRSREFRDLDESVPCVLGGDFNDWRSLLRAFFVEAFAFRCASDRNGRRGPRAIRTYPSPSPQAGLDRVYYRGALRLVAAYRCEQQTSRVASDHRPLIFDFELG